VATIAGLAFKRPCGSRLIILQAIEWDSETNKNATLIGLSPNNESVRKVTIAPENHLYWRIFFRTLALDRLRYFVYGRHLMLPELNLPRPHSIAIRTRAVAHQRDTSSWPIRERRLAQGLAVRFPHIAALMRATAKIGCRRPKGFKQEVPR
jgi:hypothetical protein